MKTDLFKGCRNSNLELLRIIAMILIVISHYSVHGSIKSIDLGFGLNKVILDTSDFGHLGVVLFVMISGYFLVTKPFKLDRIIRVVLDTLFYSVAFFVIFSILNHEFSFGSMIRAIFPIVPMQYWFVTAYVFMMMVSPFLNRFLKVLTEYEFKVYILIMILIVSISSMIPKFDAFTYFGFLGQFFLYYSLGAFIKMYPKSYNKIKNSKCYLLISLVLLLLLIMSGVVFDLLSNYFSAFVGKYSFFYGRGSILVIAIAYTLFKYFINIKPYENKFINIVSSCTFGVYLIHDNNYMREYLWGNIFDNSKYAESNYLIVHFILSVIIVYVACTVIEYIRKYVLEKYVFKNIINRINSCADSMYGKLLSLIEKC
ncbi:acyltransferase [Eubacterium sp.]